MYWLFEVTFHSEQIDNSFTVVTATCAAGCCLVDITEASESGSLDLTTSSRIEHSGAQHRARACRIE